MLVCCIMSLFLALHNFKLAVYTELVFLAGMIPLMVCIVAARKGHLVAIEFILPLSVLCRAITSVLLANLLFKKDLLAGTILEGVQATSADGEVLETECLSVIIDLVLRNQILLCVIAEIILFMTNFIAFVVACGFHMAAMFTIRALVASFP